MCAWPAPHPDARADTARADTARAGAARAGADPGGRARAPGRREALRLMAAALVAAGVLPWPAARAAENDALAFGSGSLEGALRALGAALEPSPQIRLTVPDFVENGAVVPVEITSQLGGPQAIFVLSEANPFPLVARFHFPEGTLPYVSTRIKVAQSCNIYAVVQCDGRYYSAVKATTVTVGGCGNG
jgi:sulfur-oxidizing protein SoxY